MLVFVALRAAAVALLVLAMPLACVGCLSKRQSVAMRTGQGEAMPVIDVKPGYVERIALMERYRLHDEMRQHMMKRPRVWVEEVPDDELPPEAESEPAAEPPAPATDSGSTGQ